MTTDFGQPKKRDILKESIDLLDQLNVKANKVLSFIIHETTGFNDKLNDAVADMHSIIGGITSVHRLQSVIYKESQKNNAGEESSSTEVVDVKPDPEKEKMREHLANMSVKDLLGKQKPIQDKEKQTISMFKLVEGGIILNFISPEYHEKGSGRLKRCDSLQCYKENILTFASEELNEWPEGFYNTQNGKPSQLFVRKGAMLYVIDLTKEGVESISFKNSVDSAWNSLIIMPASGLNLVSRVLIDRLNEIYVKEHEAEIRAFETNNKIV